MSSPFDSSNILSIYLEPVLLPTTKSYHNILTVSGMPPGPLAEMVQRTTFSRLSEFVAYSDENPNHCVYCIKRYRTSDPINQSNVRNYMFAEDIPNVYAYLINHGYQLMPDITKLTFQTASKSHPNNRKLVCMFSCPP